MSEGKSVSLSSCVLEHLWIWDSRQTEQGLTTWTRPKNPKSPKELLNSEAIPFLAGRELGLKGDSSGLHSCRWERLTLGFSQIGEGLGPVNPPEQKDNRSF